MQVSCSHLLALSLYHAEWKKDTYKSPVIPLYFGISGIQKTSYRTKSFSTRQKAAPSFETMTHLDKKYKITAWRKRELS